MERDRRFYLITMLPILISVVIGVVLLLFHDSIGTGSKAALIVAAERNDMSSQISSMNAEIDSLNSDIEGYNKIIDENSTLINEVNSLNSELESYNTDLENARQHNTELKSQVESKQNYLNELNDMEDTGSEGTARTLQEGEYKCPADIEKGRYRAEGDATIYIYNIANSLTVREDLSTNDSGSYEFDLDSGEKLKVDGEITLTPISEAS